jgi:hypothetical protein
MGFMAKVQKASKFVLLDTVQYRKNYFQNRNRIRHNDTCKWVTVPLKKFKSNTLIKDIRIDNSQLWSKKNLSLIENSYRKAPYFLEIKEKIWEVYFRQYDYLAELNTALIKLLIELLGIEVELYVASELDLPSAEGGTEVNYNVCKKLGADVYLSGSFGRDYLDEDKFINDGIKVIYQDYRHPEYEQFQGGFMDSLSIIDVLFNCGPEKTLSLIK